MEKGKCRQAGEGRVIPSSLFSWEQAGPAGKLS